jgi:hypothetical protein
MIECSFTTGPHPNWGKCTVEGDYSSVVEAKISPIVDVNSDVYALKVQSLIRAYGKVNAASVLSLEILSDLDKTVGMMRKPFKSATTLLNKILMERRSLLKRKSMTAAKASAGAWLEYRYGWRPIIGDCKTVMRDSHKFRERIGGKRLVVRSGGQVTRSNSKTSVLTTGLVEANRADVFTSESITARVSAGVLYQVLEPDTPEKLLKMAGLRGQDFGPSVWEIIPYSFVVDWFVGVGDWLQAISPKPECSIKGAWVTTCMDHSIITSGTVSRTLSAPTITYTSSLGGSTRTTRTFMRDCEFQLPQAPALTPSVFPPLRCLDGLALTLGQISSMLKGVRH